MYGNDGKRINIHGETRRRKVSKCGKNVFLNEAVLRAYVVVKTWCGMRHSGLLAACGDADMVAESKYSQINKGGKWLLVGTDDFKRMG